MRLRRAAEQRRFVRQVQRAGAVGIGFGIGLTPRGGAAGPHCRGQPLGLARRGGPLRDPVHRHRQAGGGRPAPRTTTPSWSGCIAGHQVLARALLTGGGLAELLKQLGGMLRTDIVLTQFSSAAVQQRARPARPTAERLGALPASPRAAAMPARCGCSSRSRTRHSGLCAEPDQRGAEQHGQAAPGASAALAGQVLEDIIHGTLDAPDAAARLAGVGINARPQERGAAGASPRPTAIPHAGHDARCRSRWRARWPPS